MEQILKLGCSMINLAEKALRSLLQWLDHVGEAILAPILKQTLPQLRVFLGTDYDALSKETQSNQVRKEKTVRGPLRLDTGRIKRLKVGERQTGSRVARLA